MPLTLLFLLLNLLLLMTPISPQCNTSTILTVTGQGFSSGIPDTALLHILISNSSPSATLSSQSVRTSLQHFLSIINSYHIPIAQIQILTITLLPIYNTLFNLTGYNSSQILSVQIQGISNPEGVPLGTFIDQILKVEGVAVSGVHFEVGNKTALLNSARENSFRDARVRAELFSNLGGFRIDKVNKVEEIQEMRGYVEGREGKFDMNRIMGWRQPVPSMYHAKVTVTVQYTLSF